LGFYVRPSSAKKVTSGRKKYFWLIIPSRYEEQIKLVDLAKSLSFPQCKKVNQLYQDTLGITIQL